MATTGKPTAKTSRTRPPTDAIAVLTADHREVKQLFDDYEDLVGADADGEAKASIVQQICIMLSVHATAEEDIFYPAARNAIDEQDLLDEASVEHASAKDLIAQLLDATPDDAMFDAKVKVLGEYIDHHVKEEEGELFPKVKRSDLDLQALGAEILARKEELIAETDE